MERFLRRPVWSLEKIFVKIPHFFYPCLKSMCEMMRGYRVCGNEVQAQVQLPLIKMEAIDGIFTSWEGGVESWLENIGSRL